MFHAFIMHFHGTQIFLIIWKDHYMCIDFLSMYAIHQSSAHSMCIQHKVTDGIEIAQKTFLFLKIIADKITN